MPENELVDIIDMMLESIKLIQERFAKVNMADDFVSTPEGVTLLDAIAMRLQVIGESVKRIQKMSPASLKPYSHIEWNKIAKLRDLVSHHYEQVDYEIVYDICKVHIPLLAEAIQKIRIEDMRAESK